MNSWLGKDQHQLIMAWGPPTSTASDGKDGQILVWTDYRQHAGYSTTSVSRGSRFSPATANTYYAPPTTSQFSKLIYVDANGVIYHWRTQ